MSHGKLPCSDRLMGVDTGEPIMIVRSPWRKAPRANNGTEV